MSNCGAGSLRVNRCPGKCMCLRRRTPRASSASGEGGMARIVGKQVALNQARFLNGYLGDARHIMAHSPNLSISADATRVGGKDILAICFTCEFQRRFVSFWAPPQAIASTGEGPNSTDKSFCSGREVLGGSEVDWNVALGKVKRGRRETSCETELVSLIETQIFDSGGFTLPVSVRVCPGFGAELLVFSRICV